MISAVCDFIVLGALAISPCDIYKLEVSVLNPDTQCIVVDTKGGRRNTGMNCKEVLGMIETIQPDGNVNVNVMVGDV